MDTKVCYLEWKPVICCFSDSALKQMKIFPLSLVAVAGNPILDSCTWEQWSAPKGEKSGSMGWRRGNLIRWLQWHWATQLGCFSLINEALKCCHPRQHFNSWIIYAIDPFLQCNLVHLRCLSNAHSKKKRTWFLSLVQLLADKSLCMPDAFGPSQTRLFSHA